MKTVFSNHELPHIWARQTQQNGRSGSMFFEGTKIYSYGRHFCMANIIKPGIVLFTDRTYSVSTAKHLSQTHGAVSHMEFITVPHPENENLFDNLNAWVNRIKSQIEDIENPRKRPQTKEAAKGELSNLVRNIERFFEVTGQSANKKSKYESEENTRKEFLLYFDVAKNLQALPELKAKLERKAKAEKKAQEKRDAERRAERLKDLLQWRAGSKRNIYGGRFDGEPVYLRATRNSINLPDEIQTSRGASVSYNAGKLLFQAIQAGRDVKGYDIDGYTVISVNGTLKIGCHEIDMKEVNRFAKAQGWTK